MIHISIHAVERFIERVDGRLTFEQARAEIASHEAVILKAAAFGCSCVRLGNGARLVLKGATVVTVIARDRKPREYRHHNRFAGARRSAGGRRDDRPAPGPTPLLQGA